MKKEVRDAISKLMKNSDAIHNLIDDSTLSDNRLFLLLYHMSKNKGPLSFYECGKAYLSRGLSLRSANGMYTIYNTGELTFLKQGCVQQVMSTNMIREILNSYYLPCLFVRGEIQDINDLIPILSDSHSKFSVDPKNWDGYEEEFRIIFDYLNQYNSLTYYLDKLESGEVIRNEKLGVHVRLNNNKFEVLYPGEKESLNWKEYSLSVYDLKSKLWIVDTLQSDINKGGSK